MDDNILQLLAKKFAEAEPCQHDLYIGQGNTEIRIAFNLSDEMFTHSFGLEHIDSIKSYVNKKDQSRIELYQKILKDGQLISGLSADEQQSITVPFPATYNPLTQKGCTIEERFVALLSFPDIMKNLHEGKVYEFRPREIFFESKAKKSNGKSIAKFKRDVSIQADFVIKMRMPVQSGTDEYNLFLCLSKTTDKVEKIGKKRLCTCSVTLISAFADGVDITARQPECKVLKHTILDKKTGEKTVPFQLKSYRPVDQPTVDTSLQNTNVIHYQPPQLPRSDVLTAADTLSQSPKRLIDRLREFAAGIAAQVRKLFSSSKQPARPKAAPQHPAERQHNAKKAAPDHADQDSAPGASPQSVKQKPFTLSGARRSELAAKAKRAGHKERSQQRPAQTHSRDDDLLS